MIVLHSHMIAYYEIINTTDRIGNITPTCNSQKGVYGTFLGFGISFSIHFVHLHVDL
jgi:hypothetical protein